MIHIHAEKNSVPIKYRDVPKYEQSACLWTLASIQIEMYVENGSYIEITQQTSVSARSSVIHAHLPSISFGDGNHRKNFPKGYCDFVWNMFIVIELTVNNRKYHPLALHVGNVLEKLFYSLFCMSLKVFGKFWTIQLHLLACVGVQCTSTSCTVVRKSPTNDFRCLIDKWQNTLPWKWHAILWIAHYMDVILNLQ